MSALRAPTARRARLALLPLLLAAACRGGEPGRDSVVAAPWPRPDRDTLLHRPRRAVYDAALRTLADSGYRLAWFDAAAGSAEVTQGPGAWVRVQVQPRDGLTRLAVTAAASGSPAAGDTARPPFVPDSVLAGRAAALLATIVTRSATPPPGDLLADSLRVASGADRAEACRPSRLDGQRWVEVNAKQVPGRCPTSALFGITPNVGILQRVERMGPQSLLETCRTGRPTPRGWTEAYSYPNPGRCPGDAPVVVLRRAY